MSSNKKTVVATILIATISAIAGGVGVFYFKPIALPSTELPNPISSIGEAFDSDNVEKVGWNRVSVKPLAFSIVTPSAWQQRTRLILGGDDEAIVPSQKSMDGYLELSEGPVAIAIEVHTSELSMDGFIQSGTYSLFLDERTIVNGLQAARGQGPFIEDDYVPDELEQQILIKNANKYYLIHVSHGRFDNEEQLKAAIVQWQDVLASFRPLSARE